MRQLWVAGLLWVALSVYPSRTPAMDELANGSGVLDRLSAPAAPPTGGDRKADSSGSVSADPIAVPTPTAAGSGLVVMAGLIAWRVARRALRRAGLVEAVR